MKLKKRRIVLTTLLTVFMMFALVLTIMPVDATAAEETSFIANATKLTASHAGKELSGDYYVEPGATLTIRSSTSGVSGIKVKANSTLTIYIPAGSKLIVYGGNASGTVGAGAGIEVGSTSVLKVIGEGTLEAYGGNGANGGNGATGDSATWEDDVDGDGKTAYCYIPDSGYGGYGGGGAGAGIGTKGGNGGDKTGWKLGCFGGRSQKTNSFMDRNYSGSTGHTGNNGASAAGCGEIYIAATIDHVGKVKGGNAGAYGGSGGSRGASDGESDDNDIRGLAGGAGGGGGGSGKSGAAYGTGGGGGGSGGSGGGIGYAWSCYYLGAGGGGGGAGASGGAGGAWSHDSELPDHDCGKYTKGKEQSSLSGSSGGKNDGGYGGQGAKIKIRYKKSTSASWEYPYGGTGGKGGNAGKDAISTAYQTLYEVSVTVGDSTTVYDASANEFLPDSLGVPSREGYTFLGYVGEDGNKYYDENGNRTPQAVTADTKSITASFEVNSYNWQMNPSGGSSGTVEGETSGISKYGEAAMTLQVPERDGYLFRGWSIRAITGSVSTNAYYVSNSSVAMFRAAARSQEYLTHYDDHAKTGGFETLGHSITLYNLSSEKDSELEIQEIWRLNAFTVTFKNFDGKVIDVQNGEYGDSVNSPNPPANSSDYYTYTFKYWKCNIDGQHYTSIPDMGYFLDYEAELGDEVYTGVEFTAVYGIEYKKGIHFVGSLGNSGLDEDGTLILDEDATDIDVITNFKIEWNDGVASMLLIPEYDASIFTIESVSVNGVLYELGGSATSSEVLSGFTVTFTGGETSYDKFKILIENELPSTNSGEEVFIQIRYRMANAVGGKYEFGFELATPTDTDSITHGDRSEAFGTYDPDKNSDKDAWEFNEVKITVDTTLIKVVIRVDGEIIIDEGQEIIYNNQNATAAELSQEILNAIQFYYNGIAKADPTTLTIQWYNENGELLSEAPKNVGKYKIGISAARTTYYNAVEMQYAEFEIVPYTIYVEANEQTFEYTGNNITINGAASNGIMYAKNSAGERIPVDSFANSELILDGFTLNGEYKSAGEYDGAISGVIIFLDENDRKNYNIVDLSGKLIIIRAANMWDPAPDNKKETYFGGQIAIDDVAAKFGTPVIKYLIVDQDELGNRTESWTTDAPTDAGIYTVKVTVAETSDYEGLEAEVTLTILKKVLTAVDFTFSPIDKIYNGEEQFWTIDELGYSMSLENINVMSFVTFKGVNYTTDCINVGTYTVNAVLQVTNKNYTFKAVKEGVEVEVDSISYPVEVKITPLEIFIDAADQKAEYTGSDFTPEQGKDYFTILLGDKVTAAPEFVLRDFFGVRETYQHVTEYIAGAAYYIENDDGTYTATTITAEQFAANKLLFGTENYVYYCVKVTLDPETITLTKDTGENVGFYTISATLGANSNYVIVGYEGEFEIYKKAILLPTFADGVYNNTVQQPVLPSDADGIYHIISSGYLNAGIHTVKVELINPNYTWKVYYNDRDDDHYISDDDQDVPWEILPKEVRVTLPNALGSYQYATDIGDFLWENGGAIQWNDPDDRPYADDDISIEWGFASGTHLTAGRTHQAEVLSVGGADADNYKVIREGGYVSITKRILTADYLSGKVKAEAKYYTSNKLELGADEFIITLLNLIGGDVIDVESVLEIRDDIINANGILDSDSGEFTLYDVNNRYYVKVKLSLIDTENYEFADGADEFDAEAFIAKANNSWTEAPTVDHRDITNVTGSATAMFSEANEPKVEFFLDSECTGEPVTSFETGTIYYVRFTVEETLNYFGLTEIFSFSPSKITLRIPTVYFGEMTVLPGKTYETPYNAEDRKFDGIVTNGAYTITYSHDVWKDVGVYTVTISLNNENDQYIWSNGSADAVVFTLKITQASLSIKAENKEIFYKENAPAYTVEVNGLKGGETLEALLGEKYASLIGCNYQAGNNAGEYDITLSEEIADLLTNYNVTLTDGKLNVKRIVLTYDDILAPDNKKFSDLIAEGLDYTFNNEKKDVVASIVPDEIRVEIVYKDENGNVVSEIKNAGNYTVEVIVHLNDGYSETNYDIPALEAIDVIVAKASITITVDHQEYQYTGENFFNKFPFAATEGFSVVYNNVAEFVDDSAKVTNFTIERGVYVNRFRYLGIISVDHTYDERNYDVKIVPGDLNIIRAQNGIEIGTRPGIVYTGGSIVNGTDFFSDALFGDDKVSYTFEKKVGDNWVPLASGEIPVKAGEYRVKASVPTDDNYEGITSDYAEFTIEKLTIVMGDITFNGGTFTYTGNVYELNASGYPAGCTVEYLNNGQKYQGTYTVTAIFKLIDEENYRFESENANTKTAELVINAVKVIITEKHKESTYYSDLEALEYEISFGDYEAYRDLYLAELGEIVLTTDARKGMSVGEYEIHVAYNSNTNYDVEIVDAKYTITKFMDNKVTLTADEYIRYLMQLNYTASALRGNEGDIKITYSSSPEGPFVNERPTTVGNYYIKAEIEDCDNYNGAYAVVPFRIDQAKLSPVDSLTITYNKDTARWEAVTTTTDGIKVNCDVEYIVRSLAGDTTSVDPTFTATSAGAYVVIATPKDTVNYEQSEETLLASVYTVTFVDDKNNHPAQPNEADLGADAFKPQLRFAGQAVTHPLSIDSTATPTIEGYNFVAWTTLDGTEYNFSNGVSGNTTLVASWDIIYYTIKFYNDKTTGQIIDGVFVEGALTYELIGEFRVPYGSFVSMIADPEKAANAIYEYEFSHWSDQQLGDAYDVFNTAIKGDVNVYAIYSKTVIGKFTVTYMISIDGRPYYEYLALTDVPYGTALELFENVDWFVGDGWYLDRERTIQSGDVTPAQNIILYGAYNFDIGAGDVNADKFIDINDVILYRRWIVGGYDIEYVEPGTEWETVKSAGYDPTTKRYFVARVSDANYDESGDIRDITTIRMAITTGYGYNIITGNGVSGESIVLALDTVPGVSEPDDLQNTLDNAIGDEIYIKLTSDITLTERLLLDSGKTVTINLNGYTLTIADEQYNYGVVVKNGTLIIEGEGNVIVPGVRGFGTASDTSTGHIVINGGNFVGERADYIFGCYRGSITINGGTFKSFYCVLNKFTTDEMGNPVTDGTATVNGGTFEIIDTDRYYRAFTFLGNVKVDGPADYRVKTAENLALAFRYGGNVTLIGDVVIDDDTDEYLDAYMGFRGVSVLKGKSVVLDLNGYTISQTKECTASYQMINNLGSLTINDSKGTGKITFNDTSLGDPNDRWSSYTIRNDGTLVVNGVTIEHLGAQDGQMSLSAIFQPGGNTTINGGVISAPYSRSVRIWNGSLTITDGTFNGQIWLHNPDSGNRNMILNISGGSFTPSTGDRSSVFINNIGGTFDLSITGGTFNGKVGASIPGTLNGFITGGTFSETAAADTPSNLFNENYELVANEDGTKTLVAKSAE